MPLTRAQASLLLDEFRELDDAARNISTAMPHNIAPRVSCLEEARRKFFESLMQLAMESTNAE